MKVKVFPFQHKCGSMQRIVGRCNTILLEDIPEGTNEEHLKLYLESVTKLDDDKFTLEHKGAKALMVLKEEVAG